MSEGSGQVPGDWRERLARLGRRAFTREEMERLGFWPPNDEVAAQAAGALAELRVRTRELRALKEELAAIDQEIGEVADLPKLIAEIRKRRIERVRAQREERRREREWREAERRRLDQERRLRTPPFLGRGVSAGLRYDGADAAKLGELGLPLLQDAADLAAAIGISERELAWLTYHRGAAVVDHYHRFTIPKKRGGERVISSPKRRLRVAQRWLLEQVLAKIPVHHAATGFRPGVSVAQNAARHARQALVIRIDLEDFFPSIGFRRVKGLFESFGFNEGVASIMALLATEPPRVAATLDGERRFISVGARQLPQGACTSPALTNVLCRKLDARLAGAAASLDFNYSRYADDLVFSSPERDAPAGQLFDLVRTIISEESFRINETKTRLMRPQHRQVVTGLVVNETPRVSRADLRRFRAFLHHCETEGLEAVSARLGRSAGDYAAGYLAFVQMVSAAQAEKIMKAHPWIRGGSGAGGRSQA
jgi:hypothetical protein